MTTKKTEPQPEYDFRLGVRGRHRSAVKTVSPGVLQQPTRKPQDRVPKTVKR